MTTLFDIGDEIELTMRGKVKSISFSENGDCYVVTLKDPKNETKDTPVYLDTNSLILSNAHKIPKNIAEEAVNAISRSVYEKWDLNTD